MVQVDLMGGNGPATSLEPVGHPLEPPGHRALVGEIGPDGQVIDGTLFRNCNLLDFDGRRHVFSHRAILTVVVVSSCNAACKFCSNEITFTPAGTFLRWDERLRRARDFALLAGVTKIAYTGGEPTLNPTRLYELMRAMNPGFDRVRLHTNGVGLAKPVTTAFGSAPLLPSLIDVGLTGASVSVAHFDSDVNRKVMRLPKSWAGMSESDLEYVSSYRSPGFRPRLSCVLTEDGVSSIDDIFEYLQWGRRLGFRNFIFRTCSAIPSGFQKDTEFSTYNDSNYLAIDAISEAVQRRAGVTKTFSQRKSDSKVDCFRWGELGFDVDESSEEVDPDAKIRRLNVMSNGAVYTSWIDPMSVLFDDDRPRARTAVLKEFGEVRTGWNR